MNFQFSNFQKGGFKVILIIVVAVVIIAILALVYFFSQDYFISSPTQERNVANNNLAPTSSSALLDQVDAGDVGEVLTLNEETSREEPIIESLMPAIISSTFATIIEIKENSFVAKGAGNNFADNQPRDLLCFVDDETITFAKNKTQYMGKAGLEILAPGMLVLIEGAENIRGKAEFNVKTINIK